MKNLSFFIFLQKYIIFMLFNISYEMNFYPETYKVDDLIFPENDKVDDYEYNLADAKVLTNQLITLYIKKQGIVLDRDDCCLDCCSDSNIFNNFNAWSAMADISDHQEIYSNAIYKNNEKTLTYKFPVSKIENVGYTLFHKVWVFDPSGSNQLSIYFNDGKTNSDKINVNLNVGKLFVKLIITSESETNLKVNIVKFNGGEPSIRLDEDFYISTINFEFTSATHSPAIAFHWTYYKIKTSKPYYLLKGNYTLNGHDLCSYSNPCLKGYTCVGGLCERCHASCFDCKNGGLTTDCDTKCSTHSTQLYPDRGSCPLGYVDLSQFDSFTLKDLVPPTRNNRFSYGFWFFLTSFPQNEVMPEKILIANEYSGSVNYSFVFTKENFEIHCGDLSSPQLTVLNTWYFTKCANDGRHNLYIKYFDGNSFTQLFIGDNNPPENDNGSGCSQKVYSEPEDYIPFYFQGFNELYNNDVPFHFYIKQFVVFREYVQEPYDNKYFSYEKIFTSTYELPEVMFIIPFDELIRNDNKYDIKCYSYSGSIFENKITLSPYYYNKNYTLYAPKLFRRLNLLERNKKYMSPDLIKTEDVLRDNNTLIASYDYSPITCIDNYFLTYNQYIYNQLNPDYTGFCAYDCNDQFSSKTGLSEKKGFCNKQCSGGDDKPICLTNNHDLLHLRTNFKCKSGYFEIFNNCDKSDIEDEKKHVFLYHWKHGPANIKMDVINYNLKSYIIEFWLLIEDCGAVLGTKHRLFYTNQFNIYYTISPRQIVAETDANRITTVVYKEGEKDQIMFNYWNHIVIEVFYDPKEEFDRKSIIYFQSKLYSENPLELDHSENELPLEYIYFCNGRRASCNNIDMTWYCAFYKNLRLFNGYLAHRYVTYRYDEYYSEEQYLLSSIKLYYPLYGHYIANNLLSQYNSKDSALNTNSPTNNWNFPQYNYCRYTNNRWCDIYCQECFDNNNHRCYECETNYYLFKDNNNEDNTNKLICKDKRDETEKFVLRLPTNANFKLTPLKGLNHAGVTVSFFIKIYGFSIGDKIDIIYLGEHLKINYNADITSPYFGLNLVTFKGSSETVISNYYHFRKHFGIWTFISVSSFDNSFENFFPPMVRFEINDIKCPIIGPLNNIAVGIIYFSNELFALVQNIAVYTTYLIGNIAYALREDNRLENNINNFDYLVSKNSYSNTYFKPVKSKDECLFNKYADIIATDKVNEEIIIPNYECVSDNIQEIFYEELRNGQYFQFENPAKVEQNGCRGCSICTAKYRFNCSCNFINNEQKIFLGNVSNHYCIQLSYINFAKIQDTIVPNIKPAGNYEFTLHFWVFAYSYIDKVFGGFSIEWEGHTTIRVGIDSSSNYYFTCLINGEEKNNFKEFKMNQWNFLHCAVNYYDSKYYIASETKVEEVSFTYINIPSILTSSATNLIIKDLTNVKDWGYLFFRYIRLWNESLKYSSPFLSRIKIERNYFGSNLLYQWDTKINNIHQVKSTNDSKHFIIKYSSEKIGTNIVPEKIYQEVLDEPFLCNETGQFYDRKTKTCINFTDISNINKDFTFPYIDLAYSHNYGIAFWIFFEKHTTIEKPINIIWQYHMQISLQYVGSTFKAYCFPQNYEPYSNELKKSSLTLDQKASNILNSATNEYTNDLSGVWTWFHCSLSYNNRYFYLNENIQELITETLYKEGNTEYKTDEPLGYFFNGVQSGQLSTLTVEISANKNPDKNKHKKIYLRCLYLFKDFIPYNYNFKYMDLTYTGVNEFPPLLFSVNFANFDFEGGEYFHVKNRKFKSKNNSIIDKVQDIQYYKKDRLELSANFVFLPLCNPVSKEKYNSETQLCEEITDCDYTALNAIYCMEEKTPLMCKKNYYINIEQISNSYSCSNYCEDSNYFRSPGTTETNGICGTNCLSLTVLKTCPNSASSILEYQDKFECNSGYNRIGYQCLLEPTKNNPNEGALFYSGLNYPYNIFHSFSEKFLDDLNMNYVLEFWFMIDNVLYTNFESNKDYYYFYSMPHQIYLKNNRIIYKYDNDDPTNDIEIDLTNFIHKYEWNKILIFVDSKEKSITLYVNFDKANRKYISLSDSDIASKKINLEYIAFCSRSGFGSDNSDYHTPMCGPKNKDFKWASAYYNNIRIWTYLEFNNINNRYYSIFC